MATKKAAPKESTENTHTAEEGDSWWSIAKSSGVPINDLLAANRATVSTEIKPGEPIKLAGSAPEEQPAEESSDVPGPPEEEVKPA